MTTFLLVLLILFNGIQAVCRNALVDCRWEDTECKSDGCVEQGAWCDKDNCDCILSNPGAGISLKCVCDATKNECEDNGCAINGGKCVLRASGDHKDECWCDPTPAPTTAAPTPCPPPPGWRECTSDDVCDDCISCIQFAADGTKAFCEKNPEDGECQFSGIGGGIDPSCIIKKEKKESTGCGFKYMDDGVYRAWYEAKDYCAVEYGTQLGTITTQEQLDCVLDLIADISGTSPWIGLNSIYSGDGGDFTYLDGTLCPVPFNGNYGQCVYSEWWVHEGRPRCPHNHENGAKCARLLSDPIGLIDNDVKCNDAYTIAAVLCNAPNQNQ